MRSGLAGEVSEDPRMEQTMETVTALLRLFCKRSVEVAGSYALGNGRRVVTERDMRCSLQYVARTFFSAPDLESDVERELGAMAEEEGSEGSEGSDGSEGSERSEGCGGVGGVRRGRRVRRVGGRVTSACKVATSRLAASASLAVEDSDV